KSASSGFVAALLAATALGVLTLPLGAEGEVPAAAVVRAAPPAIQVVSVERGEVVETLTVTGTVVAREEAAAGTDLNGMIVTALNADEGDIVRKGDILAVLDRSNLDTQLAQMDATRAQAEATIA